MRREIRGRRSLRGYMLIDRYDSDEVVFTFIYSEAIHISSPRLVYLFTRV